MSNQPNIGSEDSQVLSLSPPTQRPSYLDFSSAVGLNPAQHTFDEGVIRKLDPELFAELTLSCADASSEDVGGEEEKLKTFLRIRPNPSESNFESAIEVKTDNTVVVYTNRKTASQQDGARKQTEFKFTKVLGPNCGQSTVFEDCVTPVVEKFLKGENCLIFSYGATNSGKTYTMQGHGKEYGIIPRTLDCIFSRLNDRIIQDKLASIRPHLYQAFYLMNQNEIEALSERRDKIMQEANIKTEWVQMYRMTTSGLSDRSASTVDFAGGPNAFSAFAGTSPSTTSVMYSVWVSYAELYNERVYDLLSLESTSVGAKNKRRKELRLMQDGNNYVYIKDLTELPVTSDTEAYQLFLAGRKNLQFAATQMNMQSSRSHSFFTIRVVTVGMSDDGKSTFPKTVHRLTFCDLAGMERANQTENKGFRLHESGNINNSLITLLKVIRMLRERQINSSGHAGMQETIPFRESKLTHIFKSYFTSATHICMLVSANPDPSVADSTFQVIQNSAIASNVVTFRPIETNVPMVPPPMFSMYGDGHKGLAAKPPLPPRTRRQVQLAKEQDDHSKPKKKKDVKQKEAAHLEKEQIDVDTESDGTAEDYEAPTVVAPRTLIQRMRLLEIENMQLREKVVSLEAEKEHIRDTAVKLIIDERNRCGLQVENTKTIGENFYKRRLSLMKMQMSPPGSRFYSPPRVQMQSIAEKLEEKEEEDTFEDETTDTSDKEN